MHKNKWIIFVAFIIIIIVLLLLVGITSLGGKYSLFEKVKDFKKAQLESEMKEQIINGLQKLQEEQNNATLDDVTQEWANSVISSEYNIELIEDSLLSGKLIVMKKGGTTGKFLINQNLNVETIEYNTGSLEFEYTTVSRKDNKVKINIVVTDKVNGIKQIDYPDGDALKVVSGTKEKVSMDYEAELGQEYRFVITTGDGNKIEKTIKMYDYYYNIAKDFGENTIIDNKTTKAAYNKTYEATISAKGSNYAITDLTVTMGGQHVTTSGNNIVSINAETGIVNIKIEKVIGDIEIKVTTKKLEIKYAVAVSANNSASNTSSLGANTQLKGTPLYINIIATLEGEKCTIVSKTDNSKTVPYKITSNGKYVFKVSGTYNGKTIEEEKEVVVNQYAIAKNIVQYDAGDWTEEEINELKSKSLYNINKSKISGSTYGLNFTFGGFTYKEDTENESDIESGNIATSRNQSVTPESGYGTPKYSGWQLLSTERKKDENGDVIKNSDGSDRIYVTKIMHSGSPENFVYLYTKVGDNKRAEYILSGGLRQTGYNTYQPRDWSMYKDKILEEKGYIGDIHAMTLNEALAITGKADSTYSVRNTGGLYWLANVYPSSYYTRYLSNVRNDGWLNGFWDPDRANFRCAGIRPVVTMTDGVYIKSGDGTEESPYILGKD